LGSRRAEPGFALDRFLTRHSSVIQVEKVDFVSVPTRDVARARRFFKDPDGNAPILHRRYARPRRDNESRASSRDS
jgi:hypothetical protein